MSEPELIGPGEPCPECGEVYGFHRDDCRRRTSNSSFRLTEKGIIAAAILEKKGVGYPGALELTEAIWEKIQEHRKEKGP